MPRGGLQTCQGNKFRLRLPIRLPGPPVLPIASLNRRLDPLQHATLANPLHRPRTHVQNRGNGRVRETAALQIFIRQRNSLILPAYSFHDCLQLLEKQTSRTAQATNRAAQEPACCYSLQLSCYISNQIPASKGNRTRDTPPSKQ